MNCHAAAASAALALCCLALGACSRVGPSPETELADAQAQADEATAVDFSGAAVRACGLLSREEAQSAVGALAGEPVSLPEDASDTAESRCIWHGTESRVLSLSASGEGGAERLGAIEPSTPVTESGSWDQARLQGCCLLHAVRDEALLSLDFSSARVDLAAATRLMDRALSRVHEPLETP